MVKQTRAQRTRQALIAAAAIEFDRHGYSGTSLSAVHGACGVTMGALTFHFPAKADLASAVCREAEAVTRAALPGPEPAPTVRSVAELTLVVADLLECEVTVRAAARLSQERMPSAQWHGVWRAALRDLVPLLHRTATPGAWPQPGELELMAVYLTAGAEAALRAGQPGGEVRAQLERLWGLVLDAAPKSASNPVPNPAPDFRPLLPDHRPGSLPLTNGLDP